MHYNILAQTLQDLERLFKGDSYHVPPPALKALVFSSPPNPNVQFFALDNSTAGRDLPVVTLVGSNYGQHTSSGPYLPPGSSTARALTNGPWVEDTVSHNARTNLKKAHPNIDQLDRKDFDPLRQTGFHLVMTNLCPWITNIGWASLHTRDVVQLVTQPVGGIYSWNYLDALVKSIGNDVSLWVGHTSSVRATAGWYLKSRGLHPSYTANNLFASSSIDLWPI